MNLRIISNISEFDDIIKGNKPVVVQFSAEWCGPCKTIKPKVQEIAKEYSNIDFLYVDVDEFGKIAAKYSVRSVPAFFFIKNGETVDNVLGAKESEIRKKVEELSKS